MLGGAAAGSSNPGTKPSGDKKPREAKAKSVSQEAWGILKTATVKITEADGLRGKLVASGMRLTCIAVSSHNMISASGLPSEHLRGAKFADALVNDCDEAVQCMKNAYGDLKGSIAQNEPDEKKKALSDSLVTAVKAFDEKMKTVRKATPADSAKGKSKPKAKAKGKR